MGAADTGFHVLTHEIQTEHWWISVWIPRPPFLTLHKGSAQWWPPLCCIYCSEHRDNIHDTDAFCQLVSLVVGERCEERGGARQGRGGWRREGKEEQSQEEQTTMRPSMRAQREVCPATDASPWNHIRRGISWRGWGTHLVVSLLILKVKALESVCSYQKCHTALSPKLWFSHNITPLAKIQQLNNKKKEGKENNILAPRVFRKTLNLVLNSFPTSLSCRENDSDL